MQRFDIYNLDKLNHYERITELLPYCNEVVILSNNILNNSLKTSMILVAPITKKNKFLINYTSAIPKTLLFQKVRSCNSIEIDEINEALKEECT